MRPVAAEILAFWKDRSGTLSVETVLIFPILVWCYLATLTFWDAFKVKGTLTSATYVLGDMISRADEDMDDPFIQGMDRVFTQLASGAIAPDIRVTVIRYRLAEDPQNDPPFHEMISSRGTGDFSDRTTLDDLENKIPEMALGSALIYLETRAEWQPIANDIIGAISHSNGVFITPRFVSEIGIIPPEA